MLNISHSSLNTVLNVKNKMFIWLQDVVSVSVVCPYDTGQTGSRGLLLAAGASVLYLIASLEKDKNSKFEVSLLLNVYCFHTIVKSENCNINHHKSGTVFFKSK